MWPWRAHSMAAVRPAKPAPTIRMWIPVGGGGDNDGCFDGIVEVGR